MTALFEEKYKKLNPAQKEAVEEIYGPVMVVAGPGTGKTEILALRIGNILKKAGAEADEILCLTFTNAGVSAMRERLNRYIGAESSKINVSTFHKFGQQIVEENYSLLDLDSPPKLLEEHDAVALCDSILNDYDWQHIRPRADATRYFRDLKSLISLLKRERVLPEDFRKEIEKEIKTLEKDPESISSRGASKGKLKKDVEKKIESFARTLEVVKFYELYEEAKRSENFFDYDDVLENLVKVVEISEEVASSIKEKYLYVLIDEHQDSSGVQNEFLQKVWGEVEKPNIFVVGDDRQLIYGFGGASIEYFQGFKSAFGKAKLITLVDNYRSTQVILDASHALLESKVTSEKLKGQTEGEHPIRLVEASFPRDEIIMAGIEIKEKIKSGINPNEIAILVPKNRHVRSAVAVLRDMGVPVSAGESMSLFDTEEMAFLLKILKVIVNPYDTVALSESLFDKFSDISPLSAHKFLRTEDMKNFSLESGEKSASLFDGDSPVSLWFTKLRSVLQFSTKENLYTLIQHISDEFLLSTARGHEDLVRRVEVVRTILHLTLSRIEKNPKLTLREFVDFIVRLESYGEHIPLAVFAADEGVKVLTLHGSKGLEFDFVWIAHMDERSLMYGKHQGFTLPRSLEEKIEKKDVETAKRELYVAITRAKRFCTISYSLQSYTGASLELASIIAMLPESIFTKQTAEETEKIILSHNPKAYVEKKPVDKKSTTLEELKNLVAKDYEDRTVSVSLLNNFFECTWKWYFRSLLKLPESKSESLEFGNRVHKAVDFLLKSKKMPSDKELLAIVEEDKKALEVVKKWIANRFSQIAEKRENEQPVSLRDIRFPNLSIYGRIDLIEKLDTKNVRVTDFKTGSLKKKTEIEKLDEEGRQSNLMRQLAMYSYLLENNAKWRGVSVRESRLEFLEAKDGTESIYDKVVTKNDVDLLVRDIVDYDKMLKSGEWTERPCNYNSYGKNTECEYCKMAKIYE